MKPIVQAIKIWYQQYVMPYRYKFGSKGENVIIQPPCQISGANNIYLGDNVSIGSFSVLNAPSTKIIIKRNSYSGPRLFISTGNHYLKKGYFSRLLTNDDKKKDSVSLNWDVVIEEDVWLGANVTILCKHVGRGAVIAAGAVCTKDIPPYSVWGGVPSRFLYFRFSIEDIIEHEAALYDETDRLRRGYLEELFEQYK